jgi:hypothetical protein
MSMLSLHIFEEGDKNIDVLKEYDPFLTYWEFDGKSLPSTSHSDAAIVIVSWWTQQIFDYIESGTSQIQFSFMEASHTLRLIPVSGENFKILFNDLDLGFLTLPEIVKSLKNGILKLMNIVGKSSSFYGQIESCFLYLDSLRIN